MPYTKEHKESSRLKILQSAHRIFSARSFDAASIDEIMADAGMTRGAFYAHFSSKSALYQEALVYGMRNSILTGPKPERRSGKSWLKELLRGYLHKDHVEQKAMSCPLAFLATDVAAREPGVRNAYTRAYANMNKVIANNAGIDKKRDKETVFAITAMMIGGVAIARAIDDPALCDRLLRSCRQVAEELLDRV